MLEKKCPKCNREYDASNCFCSKCGEKLIDNPIYIERQKKLEEQQRQKEEERRKKEEQAAILLAEKKMVIEEINVLYDRYSSNLSSAKVEKDDLSISNDISYLNERKKHLLDILRYLVFYETTKEQVIKEFNDAVSEIKNLSTIESGLRRLEKDLKEHHGNPNLTNSYLDLKARIENDIRAVSIIRAFLSGGKYYAGLKTERVYNGFGYTIKTGGSNKECSWRYSLSSRINDNIKHQSNVDKAGLYAYYLHHDINRILDNYRFLLEASGKGFWSYKEIRYPVSMGTSLYFHDLYGGTMVSYICEGLFYTVEEKQI